MLDKFKFCVNINVTFGGVEVEFNESIEKFLNHMLSEIDKTEENKNLAFVGYERPYLFSNERLDVTIKRLNVNNKRVLTTGSSGDQVLYLIANGAKDITLFDLCPYSKLILDYKIGMIKSLEFEGMRKVIESGEMMSIKTYKHINYNIPVESRKFWDFVFMEGFDGKVVDICKRKDSRPDKAEYLKNEQVFNNLKSGLIKSKYNLKFINCHMQDVVNEIQNEDEYDIILLSNIIKYADKWDKLKWDYRKNEYWRVVSGLSKKLKQNGVIQIDYRYHDLLERYMYYSLLLGSGKVKSSGISRKEGAIYYYPNMEI